jgi:tRNA1Val (adenine37-N6)-methyltransferase
MPNSYFQFKQFTIYQHKSAMKVTTDACLFGSWIAEELKQRENRIQILDIGTGTGLLSLMVAQKNHVLIDAVEINVDAAEQAMENIRSSPWEESIHVINKNILDIKTPKTYDVIISNPPFYENELSSPNKEKNKAHHSTELNLRQLFEIINKQLNDRGEFFLLLPYKRNIEIDALINEFNFHVSKKIILSPSSIHSPFRIMIRAGKIYRSETQVFELAVKNEDQQYSAAFISLLKDYYLHL